MPLYVYKDKVSGKVGEILRDFRDYEIPPSREEATAPSPSFGLTEEEYEAAVWERILGAGIKMIRGPGWQGSKGNWGR